MYTGSAGFDTRPYPLAYAFFSFFPFFFSQRLPSSGATSTRKRESERGRERGRELML